MTTLSCFHLKSMRSKLNIRIPNSVLFVSSIFPATTRSRSSCSLWDEGKENVLCKRVCVCVYFFFTRLGLWKKKSKNIFIVGTFCVCFVDDMKSWEFMVLASAVISIKTC